MTSQLPDQSPLDYSVKYSVSLWEAIAIAVGALLLIAIGLAGLGIKVLNNAFSPGRAEAIARSIMTYDIPGGSKGLFGANVGGAKIAVIGSHNSPVGLPASLASTAPLPPAVELLVARIPVSQETEEIAPEATASEFFSGFSFSYQVEGAFRLQDSRTEYKEFCGAFIPVKIQEGSLTLPNSPPLPAIKYGINVDRETDNYIALVTTVGQNAEAAAETVFNSLQCTAGNYQSSTQG